MSYISRKNKIFRHLDRLKAIRNGQIAAPINVEIDISNRCNLGCYYCHFAYTHTKGLLVGKQDKPECAVLGGDLMNVDLAKSIIDQLENAGVRSLTFTGGGEPTVHPNFDEIISYPKIDVGIYTNGTNIDKERALFLANQCVWVYVSLDASDASAYLKEKGSKLFDKAVAGIRNLVEAKGSATIGMGCMIHKNNWLDAEAFVDLADLLGVDYVQFRPVILYDVKNPSKLVENAEWMNYAIQYMDKMKNFRDAVVDIDRFREYRDWVEHGYPTSYWSALQTVITPNGKVWTCVDKREFPEAEIGDLSIEKFDAIWRRRKIVAVDYNCRIMCCGHPANIVLNELMQPNNHSNFV